MRIKAEFSIIYTEEKKPITEVAQFTLNHFENIFNDEEKKFISSLKNESDLEKINVFCTFFENYYNEVFTGMDFFENKFNNKTAKILSKKAEDIGYILMLDIRTDEIWKLKIIFYLLYAWSYLGNGLVEFCLGNLTGIYQDLYKPNEWYNYISKFKEIKET